MRLNAAVSATSAPLLAAPVRPVALLGVADTAAYFSVEVPAGQPPEMLAIITADAVRLPGAMVLGFTSTQRSLRQIAPLGSGRALVGQGGVHWISRVGPIDVRAVRTWTPPRVGPAPVGWQGGVDALRAAVARVDIGIDASVLGECVGGAELALSLLGRGPGLTPSGDDLLAGLLLGARAFGLPVEALTSAVALAAPTRTTTLSARLLRHAIDGECVPEVARVLAALAEPAVLDRRIVALLRVGHTSGAALGRGLVRAGELAAERALIPAG